MIKHAGATPRGAPLTAATSDTHLLTAEQLVAMEMPAEPEVSPDGRWIAFRVQAQAKPRNQKKPRSSIWVAPADGSAPARRWTGGAARDSSPRWSADGRSLAFLSDRAEEGKAQVYRLPLEGGEAKAVTTWKGGVERFSWSPDARRISFVATDEGWAEAQTQREESGDDPDVWGENLGFHRLHLLTLDGATITALTPADRHVTAEAWAPSGREIAVAFAVRPDLDAPAEAGVDLVRFPLDGGSPRFVCHVPLGLGNLLWTEDGRALLFTTWEAQKIPSARQAFVVPAEDGAARCLTTGMHGCVLALRRPAHSCAVLCTVAEGLTTRIYELDAETGKRRLRYAPARGSLDEAFGTDSRGRVLAVRQSSGSELPQIWSGAPDAGLRRVSTCNLTLAEARWAIQEPFSWQAPDGWSLDGLVLLPPGVRGTPPGVVLAHGGPYARWTDGFNGSAGNWAQWLALDGYAVLLPNPRGGMGHGHTFAATVAGEVGMADWLDVASGADAFVAAGHADGERLGIGGWSQGGFMTAWAVSGGIARAIGAGGPEATTRGWAEQYTRWRAGSADRFRCGIDGAGPTDWGSMTTESDLPTFEAMLGGSRLGDGTGPHRHALVSPISYADWVRVPLLLLHGQNDKRVPVGQATGFFHELRRRGVPVEMVLYPREPHGLEEGVHQVDLLRRVREWYARWLRR